MQMTYQTERLTLTILHPNEADKVLAFYENNKEHFEPWEPERDPNFYTLPYQRLSLSIEYNLMLQSKLLRYWVFHKEKPGTIIGSVNFYNMIKGSYYTCQLGYKFDQYHTGNGYAVESILAAMEILFSDHKIHRIEANIMPANLRSIHLIEKLGFGYEGLSKSSIHINNKWEDHARYAYINTAFED
ncbi:GNAT family N-acetyltransferase [Anaerocolumna sp. AGMB13025]|uniref:GNAT family N-acetyltransferase n=1 Tax=Anaerocolumna sp. AGMB13025 TaxID=3039116 RepID=UPI00241FCE04|nr:GNAT family N-acetyltransferase [Anaerocolumna sp. AGMB13025]WFR57413.1 GNAT family N-acetyltransferase [Anaerocolumna sp. AGMB13025]